VSRGWKRLTSFHREIAMHLGVISRGRLRGNSIPTRTSIFVESRSSVKQSPPGRRFYSRLPVKGRPTSGSGVELDS